MLPVSLYGPSWLIAFLPRLMFDGGEMASQRFTELYSSLSLAPQDAGGPRASASFGQGSKLSLVISINADVQFHPKWKMSHPPFVLPCEVTYCVCLQSIKLLFCDSALALIVEISVFSLLKKLRFKSALVQFQPAPFVARHTLHLTASSCSITCTSLVSIICIPTIHNKRHFSVGAYLDHTLTLIGRPNIHTWASTWRHRQEKTAWVPLGRPGVKVLVAIYLDWLG